MKKSFFVCSLLTFLFFLPHGLFAQTECESIHWEKMDIDQLDALLICFSKLRTLPDAEKVFGPIDVEQEWRGIPRLKNPNFNSVQLELKADAKKNETKVIGMYLSLAKSFTISLKSLEKKFGEYYKRPQFPHYNSPIPYSFKVKKFKDTYLDFEANYKSLKDDLLVDAVLLRIIK